MDATLERRPSYAWRGIFAAKEILKIGVHMADREEDEDLQWLRSGDFSTREAYKLLKKVMEEPDEKGKNSDDKYIRRFWRTVWRLPMPNKVTLTHVKASWKGK
ncbi:hypothetical protein QQ045_018260 [Rhodiola kirilowii]